MNYPYATPAVHLVDKPVYGHVPLPVKDATSQQPTYLGPEVINGSASGLAMFPRSASEAMMDSGTKYRQLPCRTFISVGTCPYRERCVYLHDPRCICRDAKTKTRRKNKDDVVLDSLFWPIMPYNAVASKLDNNRQPHVIQPYQVPPPQNDQFRRHDEAVYSMWSHFVDFCIANSESQYAPNADLAPVYAAPDLPINAYTKLSRFPVFRVLSGSKGREIMREEFDGAELGDWRGMNANSADFGAKAVLRKIFDGDYHPSTEPLLHHGYHQNLPVHDVLSTAVTVPTVSRPTMIQVDHTKTIMDVIKDNGISSNVSPNAVNLLSPARATIKVRNDNGRDNESESGDSLDPDFRQSNFPVSLPHLQHHSLGDNSSPKFGTTRISPDATSLLFNKVATGADPLVKENAFPKRGKPDAPLLSLYSAYSPSKSFSLPECSF